MKIGIIGFGRLGRLISKNLAQDFELLVFDKAGLEEEIEAVGSTPVTIKEICQAKIIIPFVPISEFENIIKEIAPLKEETTLLQPHIKIILFIQVEKVPMNSLEEALIYI